MRCICITSEADLVSVKKKKYHGGGGSVEGEKEKEGGSEPSRRDHVEEERKKQQALAGVSKRLGAVVMRREVRYTATSQSAERKATAHLSRYHRSPRKKRSLAVSVDSLSVELSR